MERMVVPRGSLMPKAPSRAIASSGMRRGAGEEEELVVDGLVGRPIGEGRRVRRAANAKDAGREGEEERGRWLTVRTAVRPEGGVEAGRGG